MGERDISSCRHFRRFKELFMTAPCEWLSTHSLRINIHSLQLHQFTYASNSTSSRAFLLSTSKHRRIRATNKDAGPSRQRVHQKRPTKRSSRSKMPWSCCSCSATNPGGIVSTWCNSCSHNTAGCSSCFAYRKHVMVQTIHKNGKRDGLLASERAR